MTTLRIFLSFIPPPIVVSFEGEQEVKKKEEEEEEEKKEEEEEEEKEEKEEEEERRGNYATREIVRGSVTLSISMGSAIWDMGYAIRITTCGSWRIG